MITADERPVPGLDIPLQELGKLALDESWAYLGLLCVQEGNFRELPG